MRFLPIILMLALASFAAPRVIAQSGDPLTQYQQAVQIRMDDLVRSAAHEFFVKSHLNTAVISQVITTPKFNMDLSSARIASLDLKVVLVSDHPAEVIRQLRQYIGQALNREGFVLDQFSEPGSGAPQLALTLDVRPPSSPGLKFDLAGRWREYISFGLIIAALLSSLFFGGYLLFLPAAWRRRRAKVLMARKQEIHAEPAVESMLPALPVVGPVGVQKGAGADLPTLDHMLAKEKERQNFPVWLDNSGVRMADIDAIRKAFDVLPFEEALDMLSCMDEHDRNVILNQLNLNGSVRNHIKKELVSRTPVFNT